MKRLGIIVLAAALASVGAIGFVGSGGFDLSAATSRASPVNWTSHSVIVGSARAHTRVVATPTYLADPAGLSIDDLSEMVSHCHGTPGTGAVEMGGALDPDRPEPARCGEALDRIGAVLDLVGSTNLLRRSIPSPHLPSNGHEQ